MWQTGTARAIGRSLRLYHGNDARRASLDALYAPFVRPGALAFDLGAHVGDRTASFRRLGARAVALEPQPATCRALRLIHGRDDGVTLIESAVGKTAGTVSLSLNTHNPTVASASPAFVAAAQTAPGWEGQVWDETVNVPQTTLDALIAAHGTPDFVKIDVEGLEDAVLEGLSVPLAALSFEMTTIARDVALSCLGQLEGLAAYQYNFSLGESHRLAFDPWLSVDAMARHLEGLDAASNSGDVYARWIAPA